VRRYLYLGAFFLIVAIIAVRWESPTPADTTANVEANSAPTTPPSFPGVPTTKLPAATPAPIADRTKMSASDFKTLSQKTMAMLPTTAIVKERPEDDFHHAPPELIQSSQWLGKVADAIQSNPELLEEGLRFYDDCARNSEFFVATRAVCLSNLKDLHARSGSRYPYNPSDYPEEVVRVANKLPPMF